MLGGNSLISHVRDSFKVTFTPKKNATWDESLCEEKTTKYRKCEVKFTCTLESSRSQLYHFRFSRDTLDKLKTPSNGKSNQNKKEMKATKKKTGSCKEKLKWANHFSALSIYCGWIGCAIAVVVYLFRWHWIKTTIEASSIKYAVMISYWHHFTNVNAYPINKSLAFPSISYRLLRFGCDAVGWRFDCASFYRIFYVYIVCQCARGAALLPNSGNVYGISSACCCFFPLRKTAIGNMGFDVIGLEIYVFLSLINFTSC